MSQKLFELINSVLQGLNSNNVQQVNSVIDSTNMGAGEKNAIKGVLQKLTTNGLSPNDREGVLNLIETLIQSAGTPAKKQAIYNTIVQLGLTQNLNPQDQQALNRILKQLGK